MSNKKIGPSENKLGLAVRTARKALKLTQEEFARPLGISGAYVSDVEKGKATPSDPILQLMGMHYRISRKKLETGEGDLFVEDPGTKYQVSQVQRTLTPREERALIVASQHDEVMEFLLKYEETPELELFLKELKNKSRKEIRQAVFRALEEE